MSIDPTGDLKARDSDRRAPLSPQIVRAGTVLFWAISALTFLWMVGKASFVLQQRVVGPDFHGGTTLDFDVFVQAARMFQTGEVQCLYDRACLAAAQKAAGFSTGLMSWNYPPVVAHLLAPFHEFAPRTLYFGLVALNLGLAVALGWRLAGGLGIALALSYEPVTASIILGQTSLIVTAMLWYGLARLERHPIRAGASLGLLVVKPHLAWVAPIAVLAQGRATVAVRAIAAGVVVAGGWIGASLIWPGPGAWAAFLDGLGQAGQALAHHQFPWQQMPTLFVSTAAAGAPTPISTLAQISGALVAALLMAHAWRTRPGNDAVALTLIGAALASPYLYHYDLVCVGLGTALYLRSRPVWTARRAALAFLTLLLPIAGLIQNDLGAILGSNAWRWQPMGPMLLAVFVLTWIDQRTSQKDTPCTA